MVDRNFAERQKSASPKQPRTRQHQVPHQVRYKKFRDVLLDDESFMTTLMVIVVEFYGTEAFSWHPDTIRKELWDDLQVQVPPLNIDKIMAGIVILTSDDFYRSLPRFINLCNVISDDEYQPDIFDPADSHEMAWAITEVMLLDPPEDPEHAFGDEIRAYMGQMLTEEGIVNPPDVLAIATRDQKLDDPLNVDASDPVMYAAFWSNQAEKGHEIRAMLQQQIHELLRQLTSLPLDHGSTENLVDKLRAELREQREATQSQSIL